jgi:hypothetical protein
VHTKGEPRLATIVSEGENEIDLAIALDALREEADAAGIGASGRTGDLRRSGEGATKLGQGAPPCELSLLRPPLRRICKQGSAGHIGEATFCLRRRTCGALDLQLLRRSYCL